MPRIQALVASLARSDAALTSTPVRRDIPGSHQFPDCEDQRDSHDNKENPIETHWVFLGHVDVSGLVSDELNELSSAEVPAVSKLRLNQPVHHTRSSPARSAESTPRCPRGGGRPELTLRTCGSQSPPEILIAPRHVCRRPRGWPSRSVA